MFCPKCGFSNNDLNLWCTRCGFRLEEKYNNAASTGIDEISVESEPEGAAESSVIQNSDNGKKQKEIKDYMVWSIISAVLGSIAFGIVAVIFSSLTQTELAAGNTEKAKDYSGKAKLFCIISLAIAVVKIVFIVLAFIATAFMMSVPFHLFIREIM